MTRKTVTHPQRKTVTDDSEHSVVGHATAIADLKDGTVYRSFIKLTIHMKESVALEGELPAVREWLCFNVYTIDHAMALRDMLSRSIHKALCLTADLNTGKHPDD